MSRTTGKVWQGAFAVLLLCAHCTAGLAQGEAEPAAAAAASAPAAGAPRPGPQPGPLYLKSQRLPARPHCGDSKIMVDEVLVVTPRQGVYLSQCRKFTHFDAAGRVLSEAEQCEAPVFSKCD